ncbi:MAG: tetratricopeptide repeat protein [Lachnospiraceae bacterium]
MECLNCGTKLQQGDICPNCGMDVSVYKKIMHMSNFYYNEGLAKANVRDFTGAIESLKKSLYFNKKNIVARNVLGLVYFEMGETVSALSEWVISKNFRAERNPADKYLRELQKNPGQLEAINQTIKKYNQAIAYCQEGSEDMAIIQLKKVISMNSKMVRAHQLLALLYMKEGKYENAAKYLKAAEQIDVNNTTTMRYQKELREQMKNVKHKKEDKISYQSGNDTIIQPSHVFREHSITSMVINLLVGVAIGVAITCFLVVPSIRHNMVSDKKAEINEANSTVTTKEQTITSLKSQVKDLKKEAEKAKKEKEASAQRLTSYSKVIEAYAAYIKEDTQTATAALEQVKTEDLDETTKAIYDQTNTELQTKMMDTWYAEGTKAYNSYDYQNAVANLQQVVNVDEQYGEGYALYYLAQSLRRTENLEKALPYYQRVVELYPGSERARTAQMYLDQNPGAAGSTGGSMGSDAESTVTETETMTNTN